MTPETPEDSSAQETFLRPMRDINDAWLKIENSGSVFTLPPAGTARASFAGKVQDLSGKWKALNTAEVNYGYELDKRNVLQVRTDDILGRYRPTVVSLFAPENPLVLSIPRLSPLPGHTPDAVGLTAVWDETEGMARLSWSASAETDLDRYQIRMSPAALYNADAESVVDDIPGGGALEYLTTEGLLTPGAVASFKIYVILDTDNERGSNAVPVTRP